MNADTKKSHGDASILDSCLVLAIWPQFSSLGYRNVFFSISLFIALGSLYQQNILFVSSFALIKCVFYGGSSSQEGY